MQLKLQKRADAATGKGSRGAAGQGGTTPVSPEPSSRGGVGDGRGGGATSPPAGGDAAPAAILYGDTCEMVAKKVRSVYVFSECQCQ